MDPPCAEYERVYVTTGDDVPVDGSFMLLEPETDLVTIADVIVLVDNPVTVTAPVDEFTVPVPEDKA